MRRIQSLPISLRPREKILKYGPEALTLEELFSIIFITGTKTHSVIHLATKISKIITKSTTITNDILKNQDIGSSKIAQVLATLEIGKRLGEPKTITVTSAQQVFAYVADITHQEKESLVCLYLNARGELLKKELLAVGTLNKVNLLPREIFSYIKDMPVASIILVHNHPSGTLEPSNDDILFTKRVKKSADILGVKFLDHLIVSSKGWNKIQI